MRRARPVSGSRARERSLGSTWWSARPGRCRAPPAIGSRPTAATRSGCCGSGAPASCRWCGSLRRPRSFRDLVRAREDARGDLMRHRHRLSKFLLRRELRPPAGTLGAWSVPWMKWVRRLGFADAAARATHIDYLAAVEAALQRRSALDLALDEAWPQSPFETTIARLRCFRGLDTLSACGVAAEVGGFERFEPPARLTGFLGIVSSEHSSGGTRRQ